MKYKVLIIDDEMPIRKSLTKIINTYVPECFVAAEAENGAEGIEKIHEYSPDIIITDIFMPKTDGLNMIAQAKPGAKIIVITGFRDFNKACQAVNLNVFDLLLKPINHQKLTESISRAIISIKTEKLNSLGTLFTSAINDCDIFSIDSYSRLISNEAKQITGKSVEFLKTYFKKIFATMQEMRSTVISNDEYTENDALKAMIEESENTDELIDIFDICVKNLTDNMKQKNLTNVSKHIQMALSYIDENYGKKMSLEDVSKHIGLSVVHTSRLFKKETGKTVLDYINEVKMIKAKQMLATGKYKVYEVADELGFNNSHYFSTLFKKFNDFTPSEYLNNRHL